MRTIICDCNYLCYRVGFKLNLSTEIKEDAVAEQWQLKQVGVIFGFLKSILTISNDLQSNDFVFCWDSKTNLRELSYKAYKENRHNNDKTAEEIDWRVSLFRQFDELREQVLPSLGFRNVFMQEGYEADDLIAWIAKNYSNGGGKVIVSTDTDLYQLLDSVEGIYNPIKKSMYTAHDLLQEYGVQANQWAEVKSIAGDKSDNIIGIKGIGLATASKYVLRRTAVSTRQRMLIEAEPEVVDRNRHLVTLPYPGLQQISIQPSMFYLDAFDDLCQKLGFYSFLKKENYSKWRKSFVWGDYGQTEKNDNRISKRSGRSRV